MALGTQRIARPVSSEDALWQGMGGDIYELQQPFNRYFRDFFLR